MYNKLDKDLINKINILNCSEKYIDVIVKVKNITGAKKFIANKYGAKQIIDLSFISCVGLSLTFENIIDLCKYAFVQSVTEVAKVKSLIYKSKKFLNVNNLYGKITQLNSGHTCVIIDTGIYPHIDFCLGKNRIIKFVDLINNDKNPYDDNGHGTFVSGLICGNSIRSIYSGIDNNARIIVIKALDNVGETKTTKILEAMQWVVENKKKYNIKIVCMSFGALGKDDDPLVFGAEVLWDNGIVVITAAGNNGPEYNTIMSPGTSRKVITVGALNVKDNYFEVADFSSRGPVKNYYKPDVMAPGVDIISCNVFNKNNKFYTIMSGTSMSAPMVAGVVSLLFSINQNYTPDQIKYMLIHSSVEITGDKNIEGFGRLDLSKLILI